MHGETFMELSHVMSCCLDIRMDKFKGRGVVGRPRKVWNDVLLSDTQRLNIRRPHSLAQDKSA